MQDRGKTTATMKVHAPEGHAFMAAIGARCNYRSAENRLAFDGLAWDELARWQRRPSRPAVDWHGKSMPAACRWSGSRR